MMSRSFLPNVLIFAIERVGELEPQIPSSKKFKDLVLPQIHDIVVDIKEALENG